MFKFSFLQLSQIYRYSKNERFVIIGSAILTVLASITDAASFGLLIPIMESSQSMEGFSSIPILKWFSTLFSNFSINEKLIWAASALLILTIIRGILLYFSEIASYSIAPRVDARLRMDIYKHLHNVSISYLERMNAGEQSNITATNPARIGISMRFYVILAANIVIVLINIVFMAVISPLLTAMMMLVIIGLTLLYKSITGNTLSSAGSALTEATAQFSQAFYDTLNGMRMIRISGNTNEAKRIVEEAVTNMKFANLKRLSIEASVFPFFSTVIGIMFCVILISAGFLGYGNKASLLASMIATIYLMSRVLGPVTLINVARANLTANNDAFIEMDRFLNEVQFHVESDGNINIDEFKKDILFKKISFTYHDRKKPALKNFNLKILKGERIGIVGLSGSGKSTVINLLTRIYRPSNGEIIIDGKKLNNLRIESWWRCIAVVMQETFFTHKSIRANLIQGLTFHPTDEDIMKALYVADAQHFILALPNGIDTVLDDRGMSLSGGECQRLSLARAILRKPKVLILDEATSNVDVITEANILKRLEEYYSELTLIVVAHRIGALQLCNRLIILQNGLIAHEVKKNKKIPSGYKNLSKLLSHEFKK
jgi:ATP-binding cassette, subfamily B, bacterial MsbA